MAMEGLRNEGYATEFEVKEDRLKADDSDEGYKPDDVVIKHHYRFEGESNPSDMSILYAVKTSDGTKGMVVNAYGAYGTESVADFMQQCKEEVDESRD